MYQNFLAKLSQFLPSRQRCVWSGVILMENNALLIDSSRFSCIDSIALVVDSRDQKQSFCLAAAAHNRRFFFNSTDTHSITFFSVNSGIAIVCGASSRFDHNLFKH